MEKKDIKKNEVENKPYKSKYPAVNVELMKWARDADKAGVSYGKFVDKKRS